MIFEQTQFHILSLNLNDGFRKTYFYIIMYMISQK